MHWWHSSRCRRCAVFSTIAFLAAVVVLAGGCGPDRTEAPAPGDASAPASHLAEELTRPGPSAADPWASRYYDAYLAETLHGDVGAARAAYEGIIAEAGGDAPTIAARAALRLAELEALAGRRRKAIELMARASVLGRKDLAIVERADRLHARLGSLRAVDSDVRGPPAGTALEGVSPAAAERFARGEELLRAYHRVRLRPRLEKLRAGVRAKEHAMEAAVRAYRSVIALGQARAAAEFRIASLYHDLALSLMFDLPPELEPSAAARLKRSLRASAIGHLRRARSAYRRSLEATPSGETMTERWTSAAKLGLRSVEDLLGGTE